MLRSSVIRSLKFSANSNIWLKSTSKFSSLPPDLGGDPALRKDVKKLGLIIGEAIKSESQDVYEAVEKLRKLGREVYNKYIFFYIFNPNQNLSVEVA